MWFRWISDGFLDENLMQPSYEVSEVDAVLVCREVVHSSGFAGAPGTKKCPYYVVRVQDFKFTALLGCKISNDDFG